VQEQRITLSFFLLLHKADSRLIRNDCNHFADRPFVPSGPHSLKLNLANWTDKRERANLQPSRERCSCQQLHINVVTATASVGVSFVFIWLHLVSAEGVYVVSAPRKQQQ